MPINLSEATKHLRSINDLHQLTKLENGNERWRKLQEARQQYPIIDEIIEDYIETDPSEVVQFLIEDIGLTKPVVALIDPKREVRRKLEAIVTCVQALYKERKKADD